MSNLYSMLAEAQTQGKSEGEYFNPGQQGSILIHKIIDHQKGAKRSVILLSEIVESNPTSAKYAAKVQTKGTKVKKVYALSKYDWAINQLKTDLISMAGIDEKSVSPAQLTEMFKEVFEEKVLEGVICNFRTEELERKDKTSLTQVYLSEAPESQNTEEKLKERRAALAK